MNGATIDFGPSILAHAKAGNRVLSQEEVTSLGATLNSLAEIETGDQPALTFRLDGDRRGDLNQALDLYGSGFGSPAGTRTGQATSQAPAGATRTEQAVATNAARRANADAAKQQQAETLVQTFGNPWREGRTNRSHQGFVTNTHPQLAARLKAEAGVRT
jgi:hypothetical protein